MKIEYFKRDGSENIIIFFAGWSCDAEQFSDLEFQCSDLCVVYDYSSLEMPLIDTSPYCKVIVVGWSFGVWVASYIMNKEMISNISLTVALNGTLLPVDDNYGIPPKLFDLTLRSIARGGIDKFNSRLYGSLYDSICEAERISTREFALQVEELKLLSNYFKSHEVGAPNIWDIAIIGAKDIIFPVDNMVSFWNKSSTFTVVLKDTPHYPFTKEGIIELNRVILTL